VEESDINTFPRLEGKKMNKGGRVEDLRIALKVAMPDMLNRLPGEISHESLTDCIVYSC